MGRINQMNVLEATEKRLELVFSDFENIFFSVSGGKDSSTMVQLANKIALKLNKKFDIMFLDQEAISKYTVEHIENLKKLSQLRVFYHICLPFEEDNSCSFFEPQWIMWDRDKKNKWVRNLPDTFDVIHENNHSFPWFKKGMNDIEFYPLFSDWYQRLHKTKIACCVGLRSKESLNRRISINNRYNKTYKSLRWSLHQDEKLTNNNEIYRFYPIFDWSVEDIWKCTFDLGFEFNENYEQMFKNGVHLKDMRICQPFGPQQRLGLSLFARSEPETWEKLVNRVSGVNCGALYSKSKLFGYLKTNKPKNMSWEKYACFLVESISLKNEKIAQWYIDKIEVTLNYHLKKYNQKVTDETISTSKEFISWKEIARALEKNDFWMKSLLFSESKKGYKLLEELKLDSERVKKDAENEF